MRAIVAIFAKQKYKKLKGTDHFLIQVSKKGTPSWREAHFQVKSVKNQWFWAFFGVQMSKKRALTNLTNLTHLTNLTNTTNLTSLTINRNLPTNETNLTNLTNVKN